MTIQLRRDKYSRTYRRGDARARVYTICHVQTVSTSTLSLIDAAVSIHNIKGKLVSLIRL